MSKESRMVASDLLRSHGFDEEANVLYSLKVKEEINFREAIKLAADRNIVVLDSDAHGQFTPRLIALMKSVMRRNGDHNNPEYKPKLTHIFICSDDLYGLLILNKMFDHENDEYCRILGVDIMINDDLDEDGELTKYYLGDLRGSLPTGDVNLVLGYDENQENESYKFLLGSV